MPFELSAVWDDLPSPKVIDEENGNTSGEGKSGEGKSGEGTSGEGTSGEGTSGEVQQSARSTSIMTEDPVQLQKILIHEIMLLRTQSQKKDMMFTIGALIMFAILLNYIDRLHYRFHHLELQGRH